jgi:serine/threonine protein phosphatase PrpC
MPSEPISLTFAGAQPAVTMRAAGATHIGRVRQRNEDSFLIAKLQRSMVVYDASPPAASGWVDGEAAGLLLMVADGMGGQGSGDVASQTAVNTIAGYLLNVMPWATLRADQGANRAPALSLAGVRDQLSSALVVGDSTVKAVGAQTGTPRMGTTLTMAFIHWPILYVAHVGDTRCYLGRGQRLTRLTTDHTLAQQIAESGSAPPEPDSSLHNVLWNSLGGSEQIPQPQISKVTLEAEDVLLLCSDGLTKHLDDAEIGKILATPEPYEARAARFIESANHAGGSDNVTVLIAGAHS